MKRHSLKIGFGLFVLALAWFGRDGSRAIASGIAGVISVFGQTGVVNIPVTTTDISTPADPASGKTTWYTKGGVLCSLNPSGTEACIGSGGGAGSGSGITVYSGAAVSFAGTLYFPIGGGAVSSGTEANVDVEAPAAATVQNFYVQLASAPGGGDSIVFTWRDNGADTALTCTISGASATSCHDTTHSFNAAQGDLVDIKAVTTGSVATTAVMATQFGLSAAAGGSKINVISAAGCRGNTVTTCTFGNSVASASDLCVVALGWTASSSSSVPTATDTVGTSYSAIASFVTISSSVSSLALLGGTCGGTGSNTVTVSNPSGTQFNGIYPMELAGVTATTDGTAHGTLASVSAANSGWNTVASLTSTTAGDLILDLIDGQNSQPLESGSAAFYVLNGGFCMGGFTMQAPTSGNNSGAVCTMIQNSAGFISNGAWNGSNGGMSVLMIALKHS
jgi:hypothetical protein